MSKELCKVKKLVKKDFQAYTALIDAPNYVCTKCGRAANSKKNLCEPTKLSK